MFRLHLHIEWRKEWIKNGCLILILFFQKQILDFFIDISPDESVKRNTDTKFNIKSTPEHLSKVRNSYLSILDENNLIYINGMRPIEEIFNDVLSKIEEYRKVNGKRIK